MATATEKRRHLAELLRGPEIVVAPSCADALSARVVQQVGLTAIHAAGSTAHRAAAFADASLLTMTEMADRTARIADAVDLPVIGDADTGFGGYAHVARTIKEYERAGAAAVHLEDGEAKEP
jgi:2-methylisocitrate lyase-like PEP mutase family enzyme